MANESSNRDPKYSEAYLIEKERQKTKRQRSYLFFFGILGLTGIIVIFSMLNQSGGKGNLDINLKEGKFNFSVDKPIVEQAKTETKTVQAAGKTINFTTGTINQEVLTDINNPTDSFFPNAFIGENLINTEAGYVISSYQPTWWYVVYNRNGLNDPLTPINTLSYSDGSHLNITREPARDWYSIEDFVEASIQQLFDYQIIAEYPFVSYSDDARTAFLTFTNPYTAGQSYMKVVEGVNHYYIATANYNLNISPYDVQDELVAMVANFTLIE